MWSVQPKVAHLGENLPMLKRCSLGISGFSVGFVFLLQLDANLVARDWRWNCQRTFEMSIGGGLADLFFIDTNPFVEKYYEQPWANFTGMLLPFMASPSACMHACMRTACHAQCRISKS